jgi:hypothetical protein
MAQIQNNIICCNLSLKRIIRHKKTLQCSLGQHSVHIKCLPLYSPLDIEYAKIRDNKWSCPSCLASIFPFNNIENNEIFQAIIRNGSRNVIDPDSLSSLVYDPFGDLDKEGEGEMDDIDPDKNFSANWEDK